MTGGGSRSIVWTQMFADALQLPIEVRRRHRDRGAWARPWRGHRRRRLRRATPTPSAQAVQVVRRHEPDPAATPKYLARYEEYRCLAEAMREPWDRLANSAPS